MTMANNERDEPVVLVVDDDDATLNAVADVLRSSGFKVITAMNGRDALEYLSAFPPPDLALVDLMMPCMDGWAFTGALRQEARLAHTPVVVMSAGGERTLSRAPVALAYLAKPLGLDELVEVVTRYARRDRTPQTRRLFRELEPRRHISTGRLRVPVVLAVGDAVFVERHRETVACGGAVVHAITIDKLPERVGSKGIIAVLVPDPATATAIALSVPETARVFVSSTLSAYQLEAAVRAAVERSGL